MLIEEIRRGNVCKYNSDSASLQIRLPRDRPVVFVPGQVEDDASVRRSGSAVQTNLALLETVRAERPDAFILFKPHPDVVSGHRVGYVSNRELTAIADAVVTGVPISRLIDTCDEVHTISSLTGFFALLRDRPVVCHGLPFYAGWGLTDDKLNCSRRQRTLTVEQLTAAALILYPFYVDPVSRLPCTPEIALQRIREMKQSPPGAWLVHFRKALGQMRLARRSMVQLLRFNDALRRARSL